MFLHARWKNHAPKTLCHENLVCLLVFLRFTQQLFDTASICAVSDNQAMIKSLTERMSYNTVYPNSTVRADWDLLEEISTTYRQLEFSRVTFEWVKGHQDLATPTHELSTQALFNIRSDALANEFTQTSGLTLLPQSPLLSSTRCHLVLNGTTITGNY